MGIACWIRYDEGIIQVPFEEVVQREDTYLFLIRCREQEILDFFKKNRKNYMENFLQEVGTVYDRFLQ